MIACIFRAVHVTPALFSFCSVPLVLPLLLSPSLSLSLSLSLYAALRCAKNVVVSNRRPCFPALVYQGISFIPPKYRPSDNPRTGFFRRGVTFLSSPSHSKRASISSNSPRFPLAAILEQLFEAEVALVSPRLTDQHPSRQTPPQGCPLSVVLAQPFDGKNTLSSPPIVLSVVILTQLFDAQRVNTLLCMVISFFLHQHVCILFNP